MEEVSLKLPPKNILINIVVTTLMIGEHHSSYLLFECLL